MAKKTNGKTPERAAGIPVKHQAPDGYQRQATDIVGFWDPTKSETIHFVPLEAKLFDSKIEPTKPSTIVIGKLVDAVSLKAPGGEDETVEGKPGDLVGVWYKPGMSALKNLQGVKVFMFEAGELDTGKPNPMKLFEVLSKTKGAVLQVTEDRRKKSAHAETSFAGARGNASTNAATPPDQGEDDVPF
jgi:hypothetical protein